VSISNFFRAFELLRMIDQSNTDRQIRYLWEDHKLWSEITALQNFTITRQSTEYHYDVFELGTLSPRGLKKKRYAYKAFKLQYRPDISQYSTELSCECLELLQK